MRDGSAELWGEFDNLPELEEVDDSDDEADSDSEDGEGERDRGATELRKDLIMIVSFDIDTSNLDYY